MALRLATCALLKRPAAQLGTDSIDSAHVGRARFWNEYTSRTQTDTSSSGTPAGLASVAPLVRLWPSVAEVPRPPRCVAHDRKREAAALLGDSRNR
jgi:hypothetical protein